MAESIYTLLIIESPVLAGIIQKLCPGSVYVISTDGYCWRPRYEPEKNQIKAIADPNKIELRKEIKEQAQWANNIVIAADSDPSGDFIAWSLARFLNMSGIKRGKLQHVSKNGILEMLSNVSELDVDSLEFRLKNRFLIQHEWNKSPQVPDFKFAGIVASFGASNTYQSFLDDRGNLFKSSVPFKCTVDEWLQVQRNNNKKHYNIHKPLSTYNVINEAVRTEIENNHRDAQWLLQQLFQTTLPFSNESLISYPRTEANAFYSETWETLRDQYVLFGSQNELKPRFLQEIADPETPHESIHPLSLQHTPKKISGELPRKISSLYKLIYDHTIKAIRLPVLLEHSWMSELHPEIYFYPVENNQPSPSSLRPVIQVSELGVKLNTLGIARPSNFGELLDEWIQKKWIKLDKSITTPGKSVLKAIHRAGDFYKKFIELEQAAEKPALKPETVRTIITS